MSSPQKEEQQRYLVGYALAPKKEHSFIQPSLISHASLRGIDLIKLDPTKPLIDQRNLDCIIHKLYDSDWKKKLRDFQEICPNVPIIDSPESIERLHNRVSMLEVVNRLKVSPSNGETFGVPKQVVVLDSRDLIINSDGVMGELKFPVVAKPLEADGSAKSHKMYLVFDKEGMEILTVPIVLQEFVNHGGVIFKVYVVGEHVKCVKRRSLPDISEEKMGSLKGSLPFSQISNLAAPSQEGSDRGEEYLMGLESAEIPPLRFLVDLAKGMREAMGLNLFNFDVIRDARDAHRYLIIDINYFPGYAKMPCYESVLTDFLWDLCTKSNSLTAGATAGGGVFGDASEGQLKAG